MRKRYIGFIVAAALLVVVTVRVTAALLVSSSNPVINTFTVGGVDITLTETTGTEYKIIPGVAVSKDPVVTVIANSETCWLFVEVEKTDDFDAFCSYKIQEGWTALEGKEGIYYRVVAKSYINQMFPVLKDNVILIRDSLTEEELNAVTVNHKLRLTAYAAQYDGFATAGDAWQALNQGKEG